LFTAQVSFGPDARGGRCVIGGRDALCLPVLDGPVVLTDFIAAGRCPDELFLAAAPSEDRLDASLRAQLTWVVPVQQTGAFAASFYIPGGERLVAAVRPAGVELSRDPACTFTYAGFRPRIVPSRSSTVE
jgi:hypothetical protein